MPREEHDRRRLDGTYNMTTGCCSLFSERDRVRTAATLNFHIYPPGEAYDDVYDEAAGEAAWGRQEIWDNGQGLDGFGWDPEQSPTEQAEAYEIWFRSQQSYLTQYLLSDVATSSWDPKHTPESRYNEGKQEATGVAMGVYEAADGTQMIVFRGSYSYGDFDNILKWMKDWILEKCQDSVKDAWEESGFVYTADMKKREGNDLQSRCAMRAGTTVFTRIHDQDLANSVDGVSASDIKKYGYWPITKLMVRQVLAADRDLDAEPTIYISGHSQGGARASLVSMWLEKEDGKKYKTYSLSPLGVQCFSRQLAFLPGSSSGSNYLDDVNPYIFHDQITSYLHPYDVYALTDYQPGKVCKFGSTLLSTDRQGGSDLVGWFKKIVGYSGAVLYVDMFQTKPSYYFGITRYWTHSISWMAVLFGEDEFLKEDGTTDGGCVDAVIVPKDDPDGMCPTGADDDACNALYFGLGLGLFVVLIVIPLILLMYFCHCCCFKKHEDGRTRYEKTIKREGKKVAVDA
jgi:hypothetical protein